ncbi:MAG: hypothetical protein RJA59_1548 [Pseudomonadota bacterium]|jgi:hypothetical protein
MDDTDALFDLELLVNFKPGDDPGEYLRLERRVSLRILGALAGDVERPIRGRSRLIGQWARALVQVCQTARASLGLPDVIPSSEPSRPSAIEFSVCLPAPPSPIDPLPAPDTVLSLAPREEEPVVTVARRTGSGSGTSMVQALLDSMGDDDRGD